jgi:hypothetical protein
LEDSGHSVRADQPGLLLGAISQFLNAAPPIVCWGRAMPRFGEDPASHESGQPRVNFQPTAP